MPVTILESAESKAIWTAKEGKAMKADIYCRVSTDNQEREGTSLQTQLDNCLTYCQGKDYDVSHRFSEAYSGLSLERPELDKLRELVRTEVIDIVVCYSLDRLTRDPGHGVILTQELEKHHVALETVTEDVDNSELGKLITYIRGYASKLEAEKIRERTMRGKRAKALESKIPHGGFARLYGYDYDRTSKKRIVNETEAYWVKQIFELLVNEGSSTNAVPYRLRDLKAPTKRSQHWNRSSVIEILKNPAYTGKTYAFTFFQGTNRRKPQSEWIEIPDATPAIITEELFEAAQTQLKLNHEKSKRNTKQQYLLRGHLYCRQCGHAYCGHMDRTIGYYRCPGKLRITTPVNRCLNKNWRVDKLEAIVWKEIERVLDNPDFIVTAIEKQRDDANNIDTLEPELQLVEKQLRALDREQKQLLQWALKGFPEDTVVAENKRINESRSSLQSRKAALETQVQASREAAVSLPKMEEYIQLVREKLTDLDFDMKRLALDMLNIKIWVDDSNVEITGTIPVKIQKL
jgi:site-specific DNA recombinase